jgi:hypothetical protein
MFNARTKAILWGMGIGAFLGGPGGLILGGAYAAEEYDRRHGTQPGEDETDNSNRDTQ